MNALPNGLCACGSGLRPERCCALQPSAIPPAEAVRHLAPLVERASLAYRQGSRDVAERLCLDVLELAPDRSEALSVLYAIRKGQGNTEAAEVLVRRIVHFDPNNFNATNELALLLLGRGALAEAEIHARNAIRIAPQAPWAHNLMGMIMTEAQRPRLGEYHYRQVLALSGSRDPILLANLAWCLKNQGRMAEARALYRGIPRRRAQYPADPAGLGAPGGSRPEFRRRPGEARPPGRAVSQRSGFRADPGGPSRPNGAPGRGLGAAGSRHGKTR